MNISSLIDEILEVHPCPIDDVRPLFLVSDNGKTKFWLTLHGYIESTFDANVMVRYGQARTHS